MSLRMDRPDGHSRDRPIADDRATSVEPQTEISRLFDVGLRELPRPSQRSLLLHARTVWQSVLSSRGLWGPASHARPGVTAAMQQRFGADHDEVVLAMSRLTS